MKRITSLVRNLMLFVVALLLTACSSSVTQEDPVQTQTQKYQSPTPLPTLTPTPQPTFTPVPPTVDPIFFHDDFDGRLGPGWTWMREVPNQWNLTVIPGSLQINAGRGYVSAQNMTNMLLRTAPAGDFQIETRLTFQPRNISQFAGLIIYDDDTNFLQAGRAYCWGGNCVGEGIYMDYYKDGIGTLPNFAQPYRESNAVVLRLIRKATTYTFQMSVDSKVFFTIGKRESNIKPLQVGLIAGQSIQGNIIPAVFDYFEITSPH